MSDLNKYTPPPQSSDLYMAASKHFQQAKMILENIPNPDYEVRLKYWEKEYYAHNRVFVFSWICLRSKVLFVTILAKAECFN